MILLFAMAFTLPAYATAAAQAGPRTTADPALAAALAGAPTAGSGGLIGLDDFARIALIASGAESSTVELQVERLRGLAGELNASIPADADDWKRGDMALQFLYDRVLTRYSEFQTRVDLALDNGTYNCVSSALLYYYFARSAGLAAEGVETPVHAFCTVTINGKKIDVETTNPYGFDPGTRRELAGGNANETRYAVVPRSNYYKRKPVDERRFLALVYVNRASTLEKEGRFADAVGLALDSWLLQGTESARSDLAERVINYAADLAKQDSAGTQGALDFVEETARLWGDYPRYREFAAATIGNELNTLMDRGSYTEALALLETRSSLLESKSAASMRQLVSSNYLAAFAASHSLNETLAETEKYRTSLNESDRARVLAFAYGRASEEPARQGKWLEAAAVIDSGLALLPGRAELVKARTAYRQNFAIEAHNRAAAAFNAGDAAGAKAIVADALRSVPESSLLKNDLARF